MSHNRIAPPPEIGPRTLNRDRFERTDFLIASREEAQLILEQMVDIIEKYEVVTVGELYQMAGLPSTHVDEKWGWIYLGDAKVRQVREGYLLDLPPAEPIR